jgi:hypothetical protein
MLAATLLAATLCSCAALPTRGSVHVGRSLPGIGGVGNDSIRAFPSGPLPGQTPTGVVTGFLDALIDGDNNYGVARLFLVPGTTWNSSEITLYDQRSEVLTRVRNDVVVTMTRIGEVDERGRYRVDPGRITARFRLTHRDGRWRIARLPPGVLLSTSDAQRSLQPAELYFLNAAQTRLVPAPILVALEQPGVATTLVSALLGRPPPSIATATVSAAPEGLDLIGNVPVGPDGVAEVNLSGNTQRISASGLQRLSAQIVWTLRQIPGVRAVRLLDNGTPLSDIGVPRLQPAGSWRQFNPDAPPASRGALVSDGGHVRGLGRTAPSALAGGHLYSPSVGAGGGEVAALRRSAGRTAIMMGSTISRARPRLSGPGLSAPVFTPSGQVLAISGRGPGADIVEVPEHGPVRVRLVSLPSAVRAQGVSAVAVSRDGARAALVVGPAGQRSLMVGALSSARGAPRISGLTVLLPADRDVQGVAWASATSLVTTVAARHGRRAVVRTSIDGYRPHVLSRIGLPARPHQVAAAPGQPILATAGGAVWSLVGGSWQRLSTGRDPSYAE